MAALKANGYILKVSHSRRSNTYCFPAIDAAFSVTRMSGQARQNCLQDKTELSGQRRHSCHPTLQIESEEDPDEASEQHYRGLSFPRYEVLPGSVEMDAWERALADRGLGELNNYSVFEDTCSGLKIIVPSPLPPNANDVVEWRRVEAFLKLRRSS